MAVYTTPRERYNVEVSQNERTLPDAWNYYDSNYPFRPGDKDVDWESFRREIKLCMDAGVAGFLVPCMASEMNQLTHEEIIQEVKETVALAHTKENCIVIPSITANDEETRLRQCREYLELGVDGLNLNMPYTGDDEYCAMVKKLTT